MLGKILSFDGVWSITPVGTGEGITLALQPVVVGHIFKRRFVVMAIFTAERPLTTVTVLVFVHQLALERFFTVVDTTHFNKLTANKLIISLGVDIQMLLKIT